MNIIPVLFELCEAYGPSGDETSAMEVAKKHLSVYANEVFFDNLGNLTGIIRCGLENAPLLMLDAHLDEVSLLLTADLGGGFYSFTSIGHDPRILPGAPVTVLAGEGCVPGIISSIPPHIQRPKDSDKAYEPDSLYIDIGLRSKDAGIPVGTRALLDGRCIRLAENNVSAPSLDDRAGFACLLYAAYLVKDESLACDIAVVGSSMEETGSGGATVAAYRLEPDAAVIVDVTHAKTPDSTGDETFKAGGGPAIGMGPNLDRSMANALVKLAKADGIPYQIEVMEGRTGTNAWPVQISRTGVPVALVSIPIKYMHTPAEVFNLTDLENASKLIAGFIRGFGREAEA